MPLIHETVLTNFLVSYTEGNNKRTIVSPVYKPNDTFIQGVSTVFNRTQPLLGQEVGILQEFPYSIIVPILGEVESNQIKTLVGFTLKGDIESVYPQAYQYMTALQGVFVCDNSNDFIEFLNKL